MPWNHLSERKRCWSKVVSILPLLYWICVFSCVYCSMFNNLMCFRCFYISFRATKFISESFFFCVRDKGGRDTVVGIATRYGAGRSGDRIPVGVKYSAPVQTCRGTYPASCTMGTGSFPGVKRPGRGADPHTHLQCPKGLSSL